MSSVRLTETSYIVLGLLERLEPATPYDLKQLAQLSTVNFWTVPHTQIYTECARLAGAGLLEEQREQTGRRRRIYRLTPAGREALSSWRAEPAAGHYELRDVATLKLFFGAEPKSLAADQVDAHRSRLASFEELRDAVAESPEGWRRALELGIAQEQTFIRFWSGLLEEQS
ncbi:MAG: helix-turn-helix transcriptional regulator [Solirubrobacteraceae bacterium]